MSRQRQRNLELIQSRRFATVRTDHLEALEEFKRRFGLKGTYGQLSLAFEPASARHGEAVAQALIARGQLAIDLDRPLITNTEVTITRPAARVAHSFRI